MDRVAAIDPLDVRTRVEELKQLRPGWLDGKGDVPPPAALDWIATAISAYYPDDVRLPYLFPTPTGRVLAEWSLAPWALSLEIDPVAKRGVWHALNLDTDAESEKELDLRCPDGWTWLAVQIRYAGGRAHDRRDAAPPTNPPAFVQDGFASSAAFRPNEADEGLTSVYDSDLISSEAAWVHFTTILNRKSAGATALTVDECVAEGLTARPDPVPFWEHAVIDFTGVDERIWRTKSKKLQAKALTRGWAYQPADAG